MIVRLVCSKCRGKRCVIEFDVMCPFKEEAEWKVLDVEGATDVEEESVDVKGEDEKVSKERKVTYSFEVFNKDGEKYVKLSTLKNGVRVRSRILKFEFLRDMYDELEERSTITDVINAAKKLGVTIGKADARQIILFYRDNVNFDAEVVKEGRNLILVKDNTEDRLREIMSVERETIGTPWKVGD